MIQLISLLLFYTSGMNKTEVHCSSHHVCLFADDRGYMCPVRCLLASAETCQKGDFLVTPHSRTHNQQRRYQQHRSTKKKSEKRRQRSVRHYLFSWSYWTSRMIVRKKAESKGVVPKVMNGLGTLSSTVKPSLSNQSVSVVVARTQGLTSM